MPRTTNQKIVSLLPQDQIVAGPSIHRVVAGSGKDRIVGGTSTDDVVVSRAFNEAPWQRELIGQRHNRPIGKVQRIHHIVGRVRIEAEQSDGVPACNLNRQCLLDVILKEGEGLQRDAGKELNHIPFARERRIGDGVLSIAEAKVVGIVARAADKHVVPLAALKNVIPDSTVQRIVAVIARELVVPLNPKERVVVRLAK